MTETRKLRVFLCHSSQDKSVVRELYQRLLAEGWIDPWLDVKKLLPGQDWRAAIEEAVETADNIVICLSNNSVSKEGYVQKEMRYAQEISLEKPEGTIFLIPLRLDECEVPRGLRFFQWTNYFSEQKEQSYEDLLEALRTRLEEKIRKEAEEKRHQERERQIRKEVEEQARREVEERTRREAEERAQKAKEERERKLEEDKVGKSRMEAKTPIDHPQSGIHEQILSTISMETAGNISTPMYYKGDPLPFERSIVFSTATDYQGGVELHFLLGENKMVIDNVSLGKYFFDVAPAPKGASQIEVQVKISKDLTLDVSALEIATGRSKKFSSLNLANITAPFVVDPLPPRVDQNPPASFSNLFKLILERINGKKQPTGKPKAKINGQDIQVFTTLSFEEAAFGTLSEIMYSRYELCPDCKGSGILSDSPCTKCQGKGTYRKKIRKKVAIPAGVDEGTKIRLADQGQMGLNGGKNGSLFIDLLIEPHPFFIRDGKDIRIQYPISKDLAIRGGALLVPLLEKGKHREIIIPPNTADHQTFRIADEGISELKTKARGDLLVTVNIYEPTALPEEADKILSLINESLKD